MGKRTSRFVQEQRYTNHINNKANAGTRRRLNKFQREMDEINAEFNEDVQKEYNEVFEVNNLEAPEYNTTSRICIYEALKKKINERKEKFMKSIDLVHIVPENQAVLDKYNKYLENIDNIYSLDNIYSHTDKVDISSYKKLYSQVYAQLFNALEKSERNFEPLVPEADMITIVNDKLNNEEYTYDFLIRLFTFILDNETEDYHLFNSNTLKNISIFNTQDPIIDILVKNILQHYED
jgi:hypothetical protein